MPLLHAAAVSPASAAPSAPGIFLPLPRQAGEGFTEETVEGQSEGTPQQLWQGRVPGLPTPACHPCAPWQPTIVTSPNPTLLRDLRKGPGWQRHSFHRICPSPSSLLWHFPGPPPGVVRGLDSSRLSRQPSGFTMEELFRPETRPSSRVCRMGPGN